MAKPTGQFGKYAEEIVREYNKVGTGDERKDWAARDKINKILRMLSSFKLKAWVMGDGTVAIADTKPRGAKQDVNDLIAPLYNAEAKGCNAKFKVGDKVTYWVFDKKAKGDVKAVRGESVDIDDGHGGVVTFKAKDLAFWNSKVCNSTNPVVVKAMNACGTVRNGYVTLRSKSGGTAQVREGDYVEYKGKKCKVLRLDEPVGHAWIEDELEHEYQPKYFELKALNACGTAKNASDDFVAADFIFKVERAENPLNDFIHYEIKDVDKGSLPRTRKDMLIDKVKRLLAEEKRKVASLESGLRALEQVK